MDHQNSSIDTPLSVNDVTTRLAQISTHHHSNQSCFELFLVDPVLWMKRYFSLVLIFNSLITISFVVAGAVDIDYVRKYSFSDAYLNQVTNETLAYCNSHPCTIHSQNCTTFNRIMGLELVHDRINPRWCQLSCTCSNPDGQYQCEQGCEAVWSRLLYVTQHHGTNIDTRTYRGAIFLTIGLSSWLSSVWCLKSYDEFIDTYPQLELPTSSTPST